MPRLTLNKAHIPSQLIADNTLLFNPNLTGAGFIMLLFISSEHFPVIILLKRFEFYLFSLHLLLNDYCENSENR